MCSLKLVILIQYDKIMDFKITTDISSPTPQVAMPDPEIIKIIGENGVRQLIHDHYEALRKSSIYTLFPQEEKGFEQAKKNSADFFIQILGGKDYYNKNRGNPMMKKRHMPFKISAEARIVWLECYKQALNNTEMPDTLKLSYWNYIDLFSIWMINS